MSRRQKDRLLNFFKSRQGQWVPLPEILSLGIAQYNARIHELRKEGAQIENRWEIIDGVKHSWFRYVEKECQMQFA